MTKLYSLTTFYLVDEICLYREDVERNKILITTLDGTLIEEDFEDSRIPQAMHEHRAKLLERNLDPDARHTRILIRDPDGAFARIVLKYDFETSGFAPVPSIP